MLTVKTSRGPINMRLEDPEGVLNRGYDLLVEPEMLGVTETARKRMERGGKGLGARNNTILATSSGLMAEATTSLNRPRVTGSSWQRFFLRILPTVVRNSARKAAKGIVARWSA